MSRSCFCVWSDPRLGSNRYWLRRRDLPPFRRYQSGAIRAIDPGRNAAQAYFRDYCFDLRGSRDEKGFLLIDEPLIVETDQAQPIVRTQKFYLILKHANGCGGIGAMSEPAAQLGASFLRLFRAIVFDPKSKTVWLDVGSGPPIPVTLPRRPFWLNRAAMSV